MRIMWSVFVTFPEVAEKIGKKPEYACTWARALCAAIRYEKELDLAIVSVWKGNEVKKIESDGVVFYFLPHEKAMVRKGGGEKGFKFWKYVIDDFKPDLIHIHGSESMIPYQLCHLKTSAPKYLTLQGVLSNYYKDYLAAIEPATIIRNITLRDIVRHRSIFDDQAMAKKKSVAEIEMLNNVDYIGGRTLWDKTSAMAVNPDVRYIYSPEMIREEFYSSDRWNVKQIKRHRIFMHQGFKPIKGLHFLLEAMNVLQKKYPDVELYMSGTNVMKNSTVKDRLLQPGYVRYLFKKIKEYGLQDKIHFTGVLSAGQIVDELKKTNVMVLPSAIENSPNSLVEAQLVGVPCVASHVGGVPEMMQHNADGFVYTFNEPYLLAHYISEIFDSDDLAERMSKHSYEKSRERQGYEYVKEQTINNYKFMIEKWKESQDI